MTSFTTLENYYRELAGNNAGIDLTEALAAAAGGRVLAGRNAHGLTWAACGGCRLLAYDEGGASAQAWVDGIGWVVDDEAESTDPQWAALIEALEGLAEGSACRRVRA